MVSQTVKVNNPTGLHLRPAGMFCQEACGSNLTSFFAIARPVKPMLRAYSVF
jgi:phosphotransferase system HPr-like phosphotransfer protein